MGLFYARPAMKI